MGKKIIFVVPDLNMGGVTSALFSQVQLLLSEGHAVEILSLSRNPVFNTDSNICIHYLQGFEKFWDIGVDTVRSCAYKKRLGLILLGFIKNVLNRTHMWLYFIWGKRKMFTKYDVAIAYKQSIPCFYFVLNCVEARKKIAFIHGEIDCLGDTTKWIAYLQRFTKIAYVSNSVMRGFIQRYPILSDNSVVVYNYLCEREIVAKSNCYNRMPKKEKFVIVTISRIENFFKQVDWIPLIFDAVKRKTDKPFVWYIIGDGPDKTKLIKDINERKTDDLLFMGSTDNPFPWYKFADLTVLPSRTESFGLSSLESIILGTPVVVSNYPASYELVCNNSNGIIVEKNIDSFADAIVAVIEDARYLERLKKGCSLKHPIIGLARTQINEVVV